MLTNPQRIKVAMNKYLEENFCLMSKHSQSLEQDFYSPEVKACTDYMEKARLQGSVFEDVYQKHEFTNFTGTFKSKASFDRRVDIAKTPAFTDFRFVSRESDIANLAVRPGAGHESLIETTLQAKVVKQFLTRVGPLYQQLPAEQKEAAYLYLTGFEDEFEESDLSALYQSIKNKSSDFDQELTVATKSMKAYVRNEVSQGRMINVPGGCLSEIPHVSSRVLEINEKKVDAEGRSYDKVRHVYNNLAANSICKFGEDDFTFTTVSCETLFTNNHIYDKMIKSKRASSYDKEAFYRQWRMSFRSLRLAVILLTDGSTFLDLAGRMGHRNSSIYATLLSNLADYIFNLESARSGLLSWSVTNQDDSLVLLSEDLTHNLFLGVNHDLGLRLNDKKSQVNRDSVTWCGFDLNFKQGLVRIRQKRRQKIFELLDSIQRQPQVTRREVCQFLGCIFSARLILAAQGYFTSPLCFFTRRSTYLYQEYWSEKLLADKKYEEFYGGRVTLDDKSKCELSLAANLATAQVQFNDVRHGLGSILNLGNDLRHAEPDVTVFSDAAGSGYGYGIVLNHAKRAFAARKSFDSEQTLWSINAKEYFAALVALVAAVSLDREHGDKSQNEAYTNKRVVTLYVDNECTRSIFAGKRVSCRNLEIGVLTKFLQFLEVHLGTDYEVLVKRVPTHSNVWADRLSRWKTGPDTCPVKNPISWLIGGLEFGSSVHSTGKQPCSGVATPGSTTVSEQD